MTFPSTLCEQTFAQLWAEFCCNCEQLRAAAQNLHIGQKLTLAIPGCYLWRKKIRVCLEIGNIFFRFQKAEALYHVETHFVYIHLSWTISRSGRSDRGTKGRKMIAISEGYFSTGGATLIAHFWHEIIAILSNSGDIPSHLRPSPLWRRPPWLWQQWAGAKKQRPGAG